MVPVKKTNPEPKAKKVAAPQVEKEKIVPLETTQKEQTQEKEGKKVPSWKSQHENFIENIRFNRKLKELEAKGEDTSHLVAPTMANDNYVPCPHCMRKFAPATAERHIPKCKNTFNRPKPPKNLRLEKTEEIQRIDRSKTQFILKKGNSTKRSPESGAITPTLPTSNSNFQNDTNDKISSHRSPQSTLSTGNYEQYAEEMFNKISPKDGKKLPAFQPRASLKKTNSLDNSNKQNFLPDIRRPEVTENTLTSHEIKLPEKKGRDFRSQSPGNKDGKRVFMQPIPKKEELLQNYQGLAERSSKYSTEPCPYCSRKFAPHAAERHIPVCKSMQSRVAKPVPRDNDNSVEERGKNTLYMTNFGTKIGFLQKKKTNDSSLIQGQNQGNPRTNYDQFPTHEKTKNSERPPLPMKKPSMGAEIGSDKPPLPQKARLPSSYFCTSCGSGMGKTHKFCGFCGSKKE